MVMLEAAAFCAAFCADFYDSRGGCTRWVKDKSFGKLVLVDESTRSGTDESTRSGTDETTRSVTDESTRSGRDESTRSLYVYIRRAVVWGFSAIPIL
jgi:hypothetical protein